MYSIYKVACRRATQGGCTCRGPLALPFHHSSPTIRRRLLQSTFSPPPKALACARLPANQHVCSGRPQGYEAKVQQPAPM